MFGFKTENNIKATDVAVGIVFAGLGFFGGTLFDFLNIKQEYEQFEHDQKIDHANRMLREADIAVKLTDDLIGNDAQRRQIAIETIRVAVPTLGGSLLLLVADQDAGKVAVEQVNNALSGQRLSLANALFDAQKTNRENAFFSISEGWTTDEDIVSVLLSTIEKFDNSSSWPIQNGERNEWLFETGVLNIFNVLGRFSSETLISHKGQICSSTREQKTNGNQTKTAAEYLEGLIGDC